MNIAFHLRLEHRYLLWLQLPEELEQGVQLEAALVRQVNHNSIAQLWVLKEDLW